jgi:hypothetical protein
MANSSTAPWTRWWVLVGLCLTSVVIGAVGHWTWQRYSIDPDKHAEAALAPTPGMDAVANFRCAAGLTKTIQIRGVEDGFDLSNDEPATMRPAVAALPYFKALKDRTVSTLQARDFDEPGSRKQLIDHFEVPPNVVTGTLFLRLKTRTGDTNDSVNLKYLALVPPSGQADDQWMFGGRLRDIPLGTVLADQSYLYALSFNDQSKFNRSVQTVTTDLLTMLNNAETNGFIDLVVGNDTAVDFAALGLCSEPALARGMTFSESSMKPFGDDVSFLGCSGDVNNGICDPYGGDTLCSTEMPVACYKPGELPMPDLVNADPATARAYVGGEVRASPAVPGAQFATSAAASAYCATTFGPGWRVLSYREAGGGGVIARGTIPAKTRLWVDISDQPRANCWGRPSIGKPSP